MAELELQYVHEKCSFYTCKCCECFDGPPVVTSFVRSAYLVKKLKKKCIKVHTVEANVIVKCCHQMEPFPYIYKQTKTCLLVTKQHYVFSYSSERERELENTKRMFPRNAEMSQEVSCI